MARARQKPQRVLIDAQRRCLVCEWDEVVRELEDTDAIGPLCNRCGAPSERVAVLGRHVEDVVRNPHASALARLGAQKGGIARAAALTPRRRREIARAAARARWGR